MKKILTLVLTLVMMLSVCGVSHAAEEEDITSLPNEVVDLLDETGYVLVENGVPHTITEEEYYEIVNTEVVEPTSFENAVRVQNLTRDEIAPQSVTSYFYTFDPTSSAKQYLSTSYRISPIYISSDVTQISVSSTVTISRSVVSTGGPTLTSSIQSAIFNGVSGNYSYPSSATSRGSGTYAPNTNYTYSAIMFQPRVAVITGNLNYYQNYGGTTTLLTTYTASARYPVTSNGYLDGIYYVKGANSTSSF